MSGELPTVTVTPRFLPQFNGMLKIKLVYFHSICRRVRGRNQNRVIAITSRGDLGLFLHNATHVGSIVIEQEVDGVFYDNKVAFLVLASPASDKDAGERVLVLDFDKSNADFRGTESASVMQQKFLKALCHFVGSHTVVKKVSPQSTVDSVLQEYEMMRSAQGAGGSVMQTVPAGQSLAPPIPVALRQQQQQQQQVTEGTPKSPTGGLGSAISGVFKGFSYMNKSISNLIGGKKPENGKDGDDNAGGGAVGASALFDYTSRRGNSIDPRVAVVDPTQHEDQRKEVRRWHGKVLKRLGDREGVDHMEMLYDEMARMEALVKKKKQLTEAPPPPSPEDELRQQRALAALVMFICRRQTLLAEARREQIPLAKPAFDTGRNVGTEPPSVPVLPSYVDAFRSTVLGLG
jgi:hypothetical protein